MIPLQLGQLTYTPYFCEENIWLLNQQLLSQGIASEQLKIIFISNPSEQVALYHQKNAPPLHAVIWDYHVILLYMQNHQPMILDFDSRLGFCSHAEAYIHHTFCPSLPPRYTPSFRIIDSVTYQQRFYSDRSHMQGHVATTAFPAYPPIGRDLASSSRLSLQPLINFQKPHKDVLELANPASFMQHIHR